MKRKTILRFIIFICCAVVMVLGGSAKALDQLIIYLPIVVDRTAASPSQTTQPPPTTEPPTDTTQPPTTEPPTVTTQPPTTEPPTVTTQPPTTEPPPGPTGKIVIRDIFYDGIVGTSEPDEYVEIRNDDNIPIQLANWTIRDIANHIFTFPSFVMEPGKVCRIYTNEVHPEWCGFSYGSGSAIWNNSGDTAYLRDGNGNLIDEYSY